MDSLISLIRTRFGKYYEYSGTDRNDDKFSVIAIPTGGEDSTPDLSVEKYIELLSAVFILKNYTGIEVTISTPETFSYDLSDVDGFASAIDASDSTWKHDFFVFIVIEKS